MINDYTNYDNLKLYVKKNKLQEIIKYYQVFGWELVGQNENNQYEDIIDLTFTRLHKIDNKDELQLQQIYMEERLNEIGRLDKIKHAKTTSFGLCFGLIAIALMFFSIMLSIKVDILWVIIYGSVMFFAGIVLIIFEMKLLIKMYNHENIIYKQKKEELEFQISIILNRVKNL